LCKGLEYVCERVRKKWDTIKPELKMKIQKSKKKWENLPMKIVEPLKCQNTRTCKKENSN